MNFGAIVWAVIIWLSDTIQTYERQIWTGVLAFCGGSVRVALGIANSEPMPLSLAFATITSGIVLAVTMGTPLCIALGMPEWAMTGSGFITGLIGMNLVKQILAAKLPSFQEPK